MGNLGDTGNMGAEFLVTPKELIHSALLMGSAAEKAKKELLRFSGLVQETDSCVQGIAKEFFVGKANALVSEWKNLLSIQNLYHFSSAAAGLYLVSSSFFISISISNCYVSR